MASAAQNASFSFQMKFTDENSVFTFYDSTPGNIKGTLNSGKNSATFFQKT